MSDPHPPGRRRLRSATRTDGYETWTIDLARYDLLRELVLRGIEDLDRGDGVELKTLIAMAEQELTGHPSFPSGRFTNWVRFVKVDLECEGLVERVGRSSPQRLRLTENAPEPMEPREEESPPTLTTVAADGRAPAPERR